MKHHDQEVREESVYLAHTFHITVHHWRNSKPEHKQARSWRKGWCRRHCSADWWVSQAARAQDSGVFRSPNTQLGFLQVQTTRLLSPTGIGGISCHFSLLPWSGSPWSGPIHPTSSYMLLLTWPTRGGLFFLVSLIVPHPHQFCSSILLWSGRCSYPMGDLYLPLGSQVAFHTAAAVQLHGPALDSLPTCLLPA